ncbi:DUF2116 family Zn-ribbon domain-containing protein [Clostridium perfringens]|nr:DUF2116 family Zn-ribbon domain-containing protein [Clostridium perfringens]
MSDLILKRCKYCDKKYEGTSESSCCSDSCNSKFEKYMKQKEKTETPLKIIYIILGLIWLPLSIKVLFYSKNNPITEYFRMASLLLFIALNIIFPFGEDKDFQQRGVKKTKILLRAIWVALLIYILSLYLRF